MKIYQDKNSQKKYYTINHTTLVGMIQNRVNFVRRYFLSAEFFIIAACFFGPIWVIVAMVLGQTPITLYGLGLVIVLLSFAVKLIIGFMRRQRSASVFSDSIEDQAEKSIRLIEYNQSLYNPFRFYLFLPLTVMTILYAVVFRMDYWLPICAFAGYLLITYAAPLEFKWIHEKNKRKLVKAKELLAFKPN